PASAPAPPPGEGGGTAGRLVVRGLKLRTRTRTPTRARARPSEPRARARIRARPLEAGDRDRGRGADGPGHGPGPPPPSPSPSPSPGPMERERSPDMSNTDMTRREALAALAAAPLVALTWSSAEAEQASLRAVAARKAAAAAGEAYQPQFFTAHEYETVRVLVDMILPADERSGSATDAGVPEFMDFIMIDMPQRQEAMRKGLAWLDAHCRMRHGKDFLTASDAERRAVLDEIAWPRRARPEVAD